MNKLPMLAALSRQLVKLTTWLDHNFVRIMTEMTEQCPEAPPGWIGDQIVENAFLGAFPTEEF